MAFVLCNAAFIIWIRVAGGQQQGFPRRAVGNLPAPLRLSYPYLGKTGGPEDIALLGDSYVEGAGDDFLLGSNDYSLGHHLRALTGFGFLPFGVAGSFLPRSIAIYNTALSSGFFPLYQGRPRSLWPRRHLLFFYEGNDLDDFLQANRRSSSSRSLQKSMVEQLSWQDRFLPLSRVLGRRFRAGWKAARETQATPLGSPSSRSSINRFCGDHYCVAYGTSQAAAPELSDHQVQEALLGTVKAVQQFQSERPGTQVCLVYIPSPATLYQSETPIVFQSYGTGAENPSGRISPEANRQRSLAMRRRLSSLLAAGPKPVPFFDATPALKSLARTRFLHGEQDPKHLNRQGLQGLARAVASAQLPCLRPLSPTS
ncbi:MULTISPECIES: hypothetical protein [Aphanothece]|uniref:hypothetical protein n=1 Tax=Aphanothece TaxID=1121 RepID=UPI00398E4224